MGGRARRRLSRDMMAATDRQIAAYKKEQAIQRKLLAEQKQEYRDFQFQNPYANMRNYYEGMENVYEDMTVSTEAAQFQQEQFQQQQQTLLTGLAGAAGGSGIAGLAQSLANAGAIQARQSSMDIMQQERQNTVMRAQMAGQLQMMERRGASAADMAERGGAAMVQSAEMQRQSTMLGIEYGGMAGANAGLQAAYGNQMSAFGAQAQMVGAQMGMVGNVLGGLLSDRRLKKNINKIGESPSGLNIYSFEYVNSKHGEGLFQGVMSDEIPQEAVVTIGGYDHVNYSMLDVEFKQI